MCNLCRPGSPDCPPPCCLCPVLGIWIHTNEIWFLYIIFFWIGFLYINFELYWIVNSYICISSFISPGESLAYYIPILQGVLWSLQLMDAGLILLVLYGYLVCEFILRSFQWLKLIICMLTWHILQKRVYLISRKWSLLTVLIESIRYLSLSF